MHSDGQTNADRVRTAFSHWADGSSKEFFRLVAPDVRWRVIGTTPLSGTFEDKAAFLGSAVQKLTARFAEPWWRPPTPCTTPATR